jgi:hypothetical protein
MKKNFLILACLFVYTTSFCQRRNVEKLDRDKSIGIKLSYSSRIDITNPGLVIGAEYMVKSKRITIKNSRIRQNYLNANFSIFEEPDIYNNVSLYLEWLRRTSYRQSGFFTDLAIGFGGGTGTNFNSPVTFIRNPDGSESEIRPRNNFVIGNATLGLGYDFMVKKQKPIKAFAKIGYFPLYLNGWLYNPFMKLEVGLITSLSVFKKQK